MIPEMRVSVTPLYGEEYDEFQRARLAMRRFEVQ